MKNYLIAQFFLFIFSNFLISEEPIYRVDLVFIKYLPEKNNQEVFLIPEININKTLILLDEFPYPSINIENIPLDLGYQHDSLFISVSINDDEDQQEQVQKKINPDIPYLEKGRSLFQVDSGKEFSLIKEVSKLQRSRDFRVLGFKSWFQKIESKDKSTSVFLDSGFFKGSRIFGELNLYKERFLHAKASLYLSEMNPSVEAEPYLINVRGVSSKELELNIYEDKNQEVLYHLDQSRKIKNKELHYLDHPKFGFLISITNAKRNPVFLDND